MGITDKVRMWRKGDTLVAIGASWAFNPKLSPQDFQEEYEKNPVRADRDYAAIPPKVVEGALRSPQLVEELYNRERVSPVLPEGGFKDDFKGDSQYEYYFHIDMSKETDATGMGMCHYVPETDKVYVDLIHTIHASREWKLSFERVFHLVMELQKRGFRFAKVTFDSWQSYEMLERLQNAGIPAQLYSVDKGTEAYDTLISALLMSRLDYYYQSTFIKEMRNLKLVGGVKYDHPKANEDGTVGSKDTSDGVSGCVSQCLKSLVGLMLKEADVNTATNVTDLIRYDIVDGVHHLKDLNKLVAQERTRPHAMRIDAYEEQIIAVMGWQDLAAKKLRIDNIFIWDHYEQPLIFKNILDVLRTAFTNVRLESFSLNENVPVELINYLQENGRRVSSALAVGKHSPLQRTPQVSKKAVRLLVAQIKQNNITFVRNEELVKDLHYMTHDNMLERKFVKAVAGWCEFMSRESSFGMASRVMPRPMGSNASPVTSVVAQSQSNSTNIPGISADQAISRIRQKYFPAQGVVAPVQPGQNSAKRLPRIPRR